MPIKPIKLIKPIGSVNANRRNVSPKISYPSDYSSDDEIDVLDTRPDNKLLFDFDYEESSYEYEYSEKDWKPDPNDVTTKVTKKRNVQADVSVRPPVAKTPSRGRPTPPKQPRREIKSRSPTIQKESPKISTRGNPGANADEYGYYDYDSQYDYDKQEEVPNNNNQNNHNNESRHRNIKRHAQVPISNEQSYTNTDQNQTVNNNNDSVMKQGANPQVENNPQIENNPINNQVNNQQISPQISEPIPQNGMENAQNPSSNVQMAIGQNQNQMNIASYPIPAAENAENDDNEQTFQITYEQKNLQTLWKRQVIMTQDDILVYICGSFKKENYGKVHIICSKKPVDLNSNYKVGMIVRHQTGTRFTLYEKVADFGESPQIAGISFVTPKENSSLRMFRVAIPSDGQPYVPTSKMGDLSRIAHENENVPPNIKVYQSELPKKKPDGSYSLSLGNYAIVRSTKNFCIKDENGGNSFVIFKTFGGSCTIKFKPPFTQLIAYSIAVAISTSMK
ncbi:hypothetical protein M9Y10_014734 [Tritrichomonas musculus]|uniref:Tubby C-terminal domain-containing protein n=1 Tax=Tritrichomonas musculus TaxID=1915356 RepID=A0ABR2L0C3_9EUKA